MLKGNTGNSRIVVMWCWKSRPETEQGLVNVILELSNDYFWQYKSNEASPTWDLHQYNTNLRIWDSLARCKYFHLCFLHIFRWLLHMNCYHISELVCVHETILVDSTFEAIIMFRDSGNLEDNCIVPILPTLQSDHEHIKFMNHFMIIYATRNSQVL